MPKRVERYLTERELNKVKVPKTGETVVGFRDVPGFGVRVKASGSMSYFLIYRDRQGRQRRIRVGEAKTKHGETGLSPSQAIKKAARMKSAADEGNDPSAERDNLKGAKTVAKLCDEYLERGGFDPLNPVKPSTLEMDRGRINAHIKPLLGSVPVPALTKEDVRDFVAAVAKGETSRKPKAGEKRPRGGIIRGGPGAAARALDLLGVILAYAAESGIAKFNPAHGVKRPKDSRVKPPFSFERVEAVGKAMLELEAEGESPIGIRAVRHLILSGFRRMEGLTLQWGMLDQQAHCARLPDTKTGPQVRPLGQAAFDHLASFKPHKPKPTDFVFPGPGEHGHYIGAPKAWARIAKRANLTGVSLHGLRHWFASAAAEMNYSELVIAGIIGHKVLSVTGRYATAPESALVAAADAIAARLAKALQLPEGKQAA